MSKCIQRSNGLRTKARPLNDEGHSFRYAEIKAAMRRLYMRLQALVLAARIWELSHYLARCTDDGLTDSLSLRHFRTQLADLCERQAKLLEQAGDVSPVVRHAR